MAVIATRECPVCRGAMSVAFTHVVLNRYDVTYFSCSECGVLQTEKPYWLPEAYESIISKLDTSLAERSLHNRRRLEPILSLLYKEGSTFVDVGCGYGLLVRLMRDIGFNFLGHDDYCQNLFSAAFKPPAGTRAAAICAFEVLEHVVNPLQFIDEQMRLYGTDSLIASTQVFEGNVPPSSWPYYSFESGQHVTIYQPRTLSKIAARLGATY